MRFVLFSVLTLLTAIPKRHDGAVLAEVSITPALAARVAQRERLELLGSATPSMAADPTKSLVMRKQALVPGTFIQNYQLIERTALLGTCLHRVSEAVLDMDLELLSPPFSSTSLLKCPAQSSSTTSSSASAAAPGTSSVGFTPHDPFVTWMQRFDIDLPGLSASSFACPANRHEDAIDEFKEHLDGEVALESLGLLPTTNSARFSTKFSAVEEGPMLEYQCMMMDQQEVTEPEHLLYVNENYRLRKKFEGGSFGEVWRATRLDHNGQVSADFILKRVFVELGDAILLSGLREVHFGQRLAGEPHVTRFVESFVRAPPVPVPPSAAAGSSASDASSLLELDPHHQHQPQAKSEQQDPKETVPEAPAQELWLVFYDEGISLRNYLYSKVETSNSVIMERSPFWKRLRMDSHGEKVLREIMRQLLEAVATLHVRGITHRDIKPSNILISNTNARFNANAAYSDPESGVPMVKLADFGSAIDEHSLNSLYGERGPTQAEETREYQPPEVIFHLAETSGSQPHVQPPFDLQHPTSYDLWSLGVVFLEMILGSPQVFLIDARAKVKLDASLARLKANKWKKAKAQRAKAESGSKSNSDSKSDSGSGSGSAADVGANADAENDAENENVESDPTSSWMDAHSDSETDQQFKRKSYLLHVLTEFCIFQPEIDQFHSLLNQFALVSNACHFGQFNTTVVKRDPLHKGLQDRWALDLIWRLLKWDPQQRISAKDALQHAFFAGSYMCEQSGRMFATKEELRLHQEYLGVQSRRQQQMAFVVREKYETPQSFACPVCDRHFQTVQSCEQHIRVRKHFAPLANGTSATTSRKGVKTHFCQYEALALQQAIHQQTLDFVARTSSSASDPLAWNVGSSSSSSTTNSTGATDATDATGATGGGGGIGETIGFALFQGRRAYMEDFVLVQTNHQLQFTLVAVMDGHLGQEAAHFVHQNLFQLVSYRLDEALRRHQHQHQHQHSSASSQQHKQQQQQHEEGEEGEGEGEGEEEEDDEEETNSAQVLEDIALRQAFLELNQRFLKTPQGTQLFSGCTLTLIVHFHQSHRLVSANVGDSKAFLVDWRQVAADQDPNVVVVPLTRDHLPNAPTERARIESSGGFVEFSGLWRVVGQLAVSRSIGDHHLRQYLTSEPSISRLRLWQHGDEVEDEDKVQDVATTTTTINSRRMDPQPGRRQVLIVASDGLWEVFSPHEAAQFVVERMDRRASSSDLNAVAWTNILEELIVEAYIRGSLDNIAVVGVLF